jgi:hypothetical protein
VSTFSNSCTQSESDYQTVVSEIFTLIKSSYFQMIVKKAQKPQFNSHPQIECMSLRKSTP